MDKEHIKVICVSAVITAVITVIVTLIVNKILKTN